MSEYKYDAEQIVKKFFGVDEKKEDTIVLSGTMHTPDISDAEREAVLKASAMLSLADMVDDRRLYAQAEPVRLLLTKRECDLIAYALRHTADSE